VAVTDFETALPWYEKLFGRPADDKPMEGLVEWLFGAARLQLVKDLDRAGKSTVTLVLDDMKAYYEELDERGLISEALDEKNVRQGHVRLHRRPRRHRIALVEWPRVRPNAGDRERPI
jgi:hypothetical protein